MTGVVDALDRLTVKLALLVPLLPSATVTSAIDTGGNRGGRVVVGDGGGGGGFGDGGAGGVGEGDGEGFVGFDGGVAGDLDRDGL